MLLAGSQEEQQRLAEQRLQEAKKAKEAAAASKVLNVTVDVQVRPRTRWEGLYPILHLLTSSGCVLEPEEREQVIYLFLFLFSFFFFFLVTVCCITQGDLNLYSFYLNLLVAGVKGTSMVEG